MCITVRMTCLSCNMSFYIFKMYDYLVFCLCHFFCTNFMFLSYWMLYENVEKINKKKKKGVVIMICICSSHHLIILPWEEEF